VLGRREGGKTRERKPASENDGGLEKTYIWCDYGSIPQKNREVQMLAVSSLPAVSSSLHAFVIVAPTTPHLKFAPYYLPQ